MKSVIIDIIYKNDMISFSDLWNNIYLETKTLVGAFEIITELENSGEILPIIVSNDTHFISTHYKLGRQLNRDKILNDLLT